MKNYEVTIKYSKNNLAKYFTCVVKGKKGYYQKAIDIFAKYRVNLLLSVGFLLVGCSIPTKEERHQEREEVAEVEDLVIVKVRNCEYVLWFNGYGSDMEHYEGCKNQEHKK